MSTVVINTFQIPSLADAGLWGAIGGLFLDFWAPIVLAIALILFAAFGGAVINLVRRGAEAIRSL